MQPLVVTSHRSDERCDAANGYTAVLLFRTIGFNFQIALTIALSCHVFRRDIEHVRQRLRYGLGTLIRQDKVGLIRADSIGMALNQERLRRVLFQDL